MDLEYLEINGYDFVHEDGWIFGIVLLEVYSIWVMDIKILFTEDHKKLMSFLQCLNILLSINVFLHQLQVYY